jgi:exopolysaccharide production protein ExoY
VNAAAFVADAEFANRSSTPSAVLKDQVALVVNQLLALALLTIFAPLLLLLIVLVWQSDGAPIVFGHYRVGKDGKLFRCFKFRSMRRDADKVLAALLRTDEAARAEWKRDQKLISDPRITPIGHWLRKTSLDELPQLVNVLLGEMHLVGPRPVTVAELSRYGSVRWHYLSVRPGITGLWQVNGRNNTTYAERVAFDRHYVERRSMVVDAAILLKTVRVVLFREGAR